MEGASADRFGDFVLDRASGRLLQAGRPVALAPRCHAVLAHLAAHPGRLVGKDELLDAVWGHRHVTESALRVAINGVRAALGSGGAAWLETVPRRGWRFQPPQPAAAVAGNLPPPAGPLIGRDADLQRLRQALATAALVTLHGPGGVGKTRLALAAAALDAPPGGAWWVRLDALAPGEPLVPSVVQALGLGAAAAASAGALARALAGRPLRLVLDNAERVVDEVAALAQVLHQQAPALRLLVTSQRPLHLRHEQVLPLAPLAPDAALELLMQRVRQADPSFDLPPPLRPEAEAICAALDGLPLALELAAVRVPLLGLAAVQQRLDERLSLLTHGPRDAPSRQRTLRATLDWTLALLPPTARRTLACLSALPGSFSADCAVAVAADGTRTEADLLDDLETLRELALLHPAGEPGAPRLRLFDSVRARAAELPDADGAADRHLQWVLRFFTAADERMAQLPMLDWLRPLRPEADHLRRAMQHALADPARLPLAAELFARSIQFRLRAGWRRDALADHDALRARIGPDAAPALRLAFDIGAATLGGLGLMWPVDEPLASAERAADALQAAGDAARTIHMLQCQMTMQQRLQQPLERRRALLERMRALERPGWSPLQRRTRVWQEALLLRAAGDLATYAERSLDVLATARALGDLQMAWVAAQAVAQTMVVGGDLAAAEVTMARVIDEMRAERCLREHATALALLATIRAELGGASARETVAEACELLHADGMVWWMADALAWLALHAGRAHDAARLQAWADALVAARNDGRGVMFATLRQRLLARLGQPLPADPRLTDEEAVALALA